MKEIPKKILNKLLGVALLWFYLFLPVVATSQASTNNAGFVNGIWYSKNPFFSGETIRIYTAIQNQSGADIQGTANFLNNGEKIGSSNFSVVNGRLIEVWTDWKVSYGTYDISVELTNVKRVEIGKDSVDISLEFNTLVNKKIFVDNDSDSDGIGDKEDEDDDNDGLTDKEEKRFGSDPLKADSDGDGIPDKEDKKPTVFDKPEEEKEVEEKKAEKKEITLPENTPKVIKQITSVIPPVISSGVAKAGGSFSGVLTQQKQTIDEKIESIKANIKKRKRADIDKSGRVDIFDFNLLIVNWGNNFTNQDADINQDKVINIFDFNLLIVEWSLF